MNLLLDAHTLIWYTLGVPKLSAVAEAAIANSANRCLVSTATYWEIAIKAGLGKLQLHQPFQQFQTACEIVYRFSTCQIEPRHTERVAILPYPTAHRDPFDRMIAAQSLVDSIPVVSNDPALDAYGVTRIW
jgi:PIN domain nuclease of toxin-antitoxin system